jgi:hypothetical protein
MLSGATISAQPMKMVRVREKPLNARGKTTVRILGGEAPPTTEITWRERISSTVRDCGSELGVIS